MLNDATGFKHIYIATGYTDLRKGIDGLSILIHSQFDLNPFVEGSIFLFCGKRCDRMKALVYEGDGFLLMYKRLVCGKYKWPRNGEEAKQITEQQYRWLMEGLEIEQKKVIGKSKPERM
jgi:transposase